MNTKMHKLDFRCIVFLIITFLVKSFEGQPMPRQFSVFQEAIPDVSFWSYGDNQFGPPHWPRLFPNDCSGRQESPVNIQTTETIYDPTLKDFAIFFDPPAAGSKFDVHNNGHAVEVNTVGKFFVTNGGLNNLYQTSQFHFHWGKNSLQGSEHTVDGEHAPIEMHIVNWNRDKYTSSDEAARHVGGLAVFSVLFEISKEDNPQLEPIVRVLHRVRDPDQHVLVTIPAISIKEFLPKYPDRYFRYSGSLTTPNCSQTVIWTVFEQKQKISERQLIYFRQMFTSSIDPINRSQGRRNMLNPQGPALQQRALLVDNFRYVQRLNGRKVFRSFPKLGPPQPVCDVQIGFRIKVHT